VWLPQIAAIAGLHRCKKIQRDANGLGHGLCALGFAGISIAILPAALAINVSVNEALKMPMKRKLQQQHLLQLQLQQQQQFRPGQKGSCHKIRGKYVGSSSSSQLATNEFCAPNNK